MSKKRGGFIAIHLGAGAHQNSRKEDEQFQNLCKIACSKGLQVLSNGGSADEAIITAICELESSGLCNAGRGSVLNLAKEVECDAALMNCDGYFGSVGGLGGIVNPILVAKKIADLQIEGNYRKDRIPPNFITGPGALNFAKDHGIPTTLPQELICERSLRFYNKHINSPEEIIAQDEDFDCVADTIGAVAVDDGGRLASGVSSGGIWFKIPGRIGHSPIFGSGCFCSKGDPTRGLSSLAISTTGSGELLSKCRLAYEAAQAIRNEQLKDGEKSPAQILPEIFKSHFLESQLLRLHKEPKIIGLICLEETGFSRELLLLHTSSNIIVAYGSANSPRIQVKFSSLDPGQIPGGSYKLQAWPIR